VANRDWNGPNWWEPSGRAPAPGAPRKSTRVSTRPVPHGTPKARSWTPARPPLAPYRTRLASIVTPRLVAAFAAGLFGALALAGAVALALAWANDGRVMPNVHVGSVDVSGLTREEAIRRLDSAYAYLREGQVVVTTPAGKSIVTYAQSGRGPDSAAMADAALRSGRSDNPVIGVAAAIRTLIGGYDVPVVVKLDPLALQTRLAEATAPDTIAPKDASVVRQGDSYVVEPSTNGQGIDQRALATQVIDSLARADAPGEIGIESKPVALIPTVSDAEAQAAAIAASKMAVSVDLTYGGKVWHVEASTVRDWIAFGLPSGGTYGPGIDPSYVNWYLQAVARDIYVAPVEPRILYKGGTPSGLTASQPGQALDVPASMQAIAAYLGSLASGNPPQANVALVVNQLPPKLTVDPALAGFVDIGAWQTTYFSLENNGYGANIQVPAQLINGTIVVPGQQFSFLGAAGPIDEAHGYKPGGVILNGISDPTGAIGGGICSASTTFFNAAALAGLQIDERHAHSYYISRYPVGRDATVYSNDARTYDMRFTNDTQNPIVIRSWWSGKSTRVIHVQLWSLPTGRTTTFAGGIKSDTVKATDATKMVRSLPPGQKTHRVEYPADGFDTVVTRTVKDATGAVIHYDTWSSSYIVVDGLLQVAITPTPSPTPPPSPQLTPTPSP
jgi:vancomycin resistance protein YoaR